MRDEQAYHFLLLFVDLSLVLFHYFLQLFPPFLFLFLKEKSFTFVSERVSDGSTRCSLFLPLDGTFIGLLVFPRFSLE